MRGRRIHGTFGCVEYRLTIRERRNTMGFGFGDRLTMRERRIVRGLGFWYRLSSTAHTVHLS